MNTWINGKVLPEAKAVINVREEGLRYGNGLFETVRIYHRIPAFLSRHLKRMYHSAEILGFTPTYPESVIIFAATRLVHLNQVADGILRIYSTPESFWITTSPHIPYHETMYQSGMSALLTDLRRNESSALVGLKTINYLENILAKRKASSLNFDEAIFLNTKGNIAEGTVSNIFLLKEEKLITPSLASGILPGITREVVLELALENHMIVEERDVAKTELFSADECFLTNSLMEIMPLIKVGTKGIGSGKPGRVTTELLNKYRKKINN